MSHEEKIECMRLACGICNFGIDHKNMDLLVSLYELILEKKDNANIKDALQVQREVKERDDVKKRSELLDKVSVKI